MAKSILAQLAEARDQVRERPATQTNATISYAGTVEMAEALLEKLAVDHGWVLNIDGIRNAGTLKGTTIPVVSVAAKSFPAPGTPNGNFSYYTKAGHLVVSGIMPLDPAEFGFTALS